jgi:hypothetical protein
MQVPRPKFLTVPLRVDRPLSTVALDGHLQITRTSVWAHYVLGTAPWWFLANGPREHLIGQTASGYAGLAGHAIRLRVTSRPLDPAEWARQMHHATPDPLPAVRGVRRNWGTYLDEGQAALAGHLERVVMLGVRLGDAPRRAGVLSAELLETERSIAEHLAGPGFAGRRAECAEVLWLMHRSVALGAPAPPLPTWAEALEDPREVAESVRWETTPFGRTVRVIAQRPGGDVDHHVAILTMGRMEDQRFPENGRPPWLAFAERLAERDPADPTGKRLRAVPVEVSVSGRIIDGRDATATASRWLLRAQHLRRHYSEHGEAPPPAVDRTIDHATAVYDEVAEAPPDVAARFEGVIRLAVTGATEVQANDRAAALIKAYGTNAKMWPVHLRGPADLLREYIPGEPWDTSGYVRRLPVRYLAAGFPNASEQVGTPTGPILGETCGASATPRVVLHDGHFPMSHNTPGDANDNSGVVGIVAKKGSGKSTTLGMLAVDRAERGIPTVVTDFSGPLARICDLPHLAPFSRHIALESARAGTLNPYRLVAEPDPSHYGTEADWRDACVQAASHRRELVTDTLLGLLPWRTRQRDRVEDRVTIAVQRAGSAITNTLWDVLDQLRPLEDEITELLEGLAAGPARLLFPDPSQPPEPLTTGALLTVVTIGNRPLPEADSHPETWEPRQRVSIALLNLAAHFATQLVYTGRMNMPKSVFIDEIRMLGYWPSGRTLVDRLGPDSRKYFAEVGLAGQDPEHLTRLGVQTHLGGVLIGRQTDPDAIREALVLAGIPIGVGYEEVLRNLGTGEYLYRDTFGRIAKIRVRVASAELLAVLNTTPTAPTRAEDEGRAA